ncbi:MAG TPA: N-formylglutamate amidohydrolase [Rhizomicrobium sp.]|jgi:N-formylglutamate deformylase|nr:N-formylglutamate amidohydrolase [Rhizomicrobium sp.]
MAESWRAERHGVFDAVLAALYAHPFKIRRPERQRVPFVFASPHSGRLYPASFVAQSRLDPHCLRRSEDAYADTLFGGALSLGAPMIAARFPRAFVDANRAPGELDPSMFDGPLAVGADAPNARVNAGLGVIPRIVRDGAEIYRAKLRPEDAQERIARLHVPYHAALARLIEETRAQFGIAILIDCHSMPSAAAVPDVVLGDRFGAAASPALTRWAEAAFARSGFGVARNAPYAGGYTTHLYGRREAHVHALQIEINRTLYLDEESIEPHANFGAVRERLNAALNRLTSLDPDELGRAGAAPLAAE